MARSLGRSARFVALMTVALLLGSLGQMSAGAAKRRKPDSAVSAYCTMLAEPTVSYAPCKKARRSVFTVDDPANSVGQYSSIAIGRDGKPVISYYDSTADALKVAKCNDRECRPGGERITTVDRSSGSDLGKYSSIAVGTDGNPVVSYHDATAGTLKVAKCNDPACTDRNERITTVDDPASAVGLYTSIAIGTDGNPVISHHNETGGTLRVAKCNDPACRGGDETRTTVDSSGVDVGEDTSIAIGADGNPVISYELKDVDLKVAKCNDPACTGTPETITLVSGGGEFSGRFTSIAVGTNGNPVISFHAGVPSALRFVRCNDPACEDNDEVVHTLDDRPTTVGVDTSIAIGRDGNPVISHVDVSDGAEIVKCNDADCTPAGVSIRSVDNIGSSVTHTSIAIGTDGNPVVSYHSSGTLKVARISD